MHERKVVSGLNTEEIWQQIGQDLNEDLLEYNVLIRQGDKEITLDIDIDLGGGFEGGYAETALVSPLLNSDDFRFAIHKEGIGDEIGKFFGMQDIKIGYDEFDRRFIIKTNSPERVKQLFTDEQVRSTLLSMKEPFTFGTITHDDKKVLEFSSDSGITDPGLLKTIYQAFYAVLVALDERSAT
ncbi:hypothetical protein EXU57_01855 [Segetibacter sp. 3557_3]|uniref:hypothetical protein n=1 Tax=Segetibacter sp. 3557_3 TaxID=2547429 RepID=UPI00105856E6|nr:hypothetical protein [Segetibacter sp. 3557_3]TDH28840.1 hypothetical protein EXU57_01855 [Segetibacter sp. 3557_3]